MTWDRIPVRIRLASDGESAPFGECSQEDLSRVIYTVESWGTHPDAVYVVAQFDPVRGCFEVIVGDE